MTYRKPDPDARQAQADKQRAEAHVETLAAEGQRRRAEFEAARKAETAGADTAANAAAERLEARVEAGSSSGRGCMLVGGSAVVFAVTAFWGRDLGLPVPVILALVALSVAVAVGGIVARVRWRRKLVPAARAHIARLPFEVRGYFEALGCDTDLDVIETRLVFQSDNSAPEPRTVADVVGRIAPDVVVTESDGERDRALFSEKTARTCVATVERGIRIHRRMKPNYGTFEYTTDTRWRVLQNDMSEIFPWMRDLVNEVIVPLHARFPLERVEFHVADR